MIVHTMKFYPANQLIYCTLQVGLLVAVTGTLNNHLWHLICHLCTKASKLES